MAHPGGSVVSVLDSWPGGCEFDPRLRWFLFPVYFHLSLLQKHVRKVVVGYGKKSCVSTGVWKPGNTYLCRNRHDILAVKVVLNPSATNQLELYIDAKKETMWEEVKTTIFSFSHIFYPFKKKFSV